MRGEREEGKGGTIVQWTNTSNFLHTDESLSLTNFIRPWSPLPLYQVTVMRILLLFTPRTLLSQIRHTVYSPTTFARDCDINPDSLHNTFITQNLHHTVTSPINPFLTRVGCEPCFISHYFHSETKTPPRNVGAYFSTRSGKRSIRKLTLDLS